MNDALREAQGDSNFRQFSLSNSPLEGWSQTGVNFVIPP